MLSNWSSKRIDSDDNDDDDDDSEEPTVQLPHTMLVEDKLLLDWSDKGIYSDGSGEEPTV